MTIPPDPTPLPPFIQREEKRIVSEYDLLSTEVRHGLADGVKIGGSVLVVLGIIQAALPHVDLPGADTASITGIVAAASAAVSYLLRHFAKAATSA